MKLNFVTVVLLALTLTACSKKEIITPTPVTPVPSQIVHKIINFELEYQHHIELDLNEDGVYDFSFVSQLASDQIRSWTFLAALGDTQSGSKILVQNGPDQTLLTDYWAVPFQKDAVINETNNNGFEWSSGQKKGFLLATSVNGTLTSYRGPWAGKLHYYMAVKFKINDKYHYGWIGITHPGGKERILVEEFAYNKTAEQSIVTGKY